MEVPVCELYRKNWHSVDVLAMRFIPSLRLEGQAGESAAIWVIFFTFQEQLSSINVKKNHCSAPLVGTLSRVVATHAFFSLWCLNSKCSTCQMEYKVMLNIPNASVTVKNGVMRMMSGIIVLLFSKKALHWRVEHVCAGGRGALPIWFIQVSYGQLNTRSWVLNRVQNFTIERLEQCLLGLKALKRMWKLAMSSLHLQYQ